MSGKGHGNVRNLWLWQPYTFLVLVFHFEVVTITFFLIVIVLFCLAFLFFVIVLFAFSCWAVQKCFTRGWCGRNFKLVKWPFIFTMSFSSCNQSHNHSYFNFRFFPWGLQHIRKKAFTGTKFWIVSSKCNWNWSQSSCSVLRCCKNWHYIFYHQICMDTHFKDCFQLDSSCQVLSPWQRFM